MSKFSQQAVARNRGLYHFNGFIRGDAKDLPSTDVNREAKKQPYFLDYFKVVLYLNKTLEGNAVLEKL